ncbi:MAG TPA: efflux RND transporter periplasmic adaptor subunit, partial [Gallionella sp.]|nr:efflux RND transporter periplasmic adaptor subunit [Gallionella sp.]
MKSVTGIIAAAVVLLGVGAAGYWFGTRTVPAPSAQVAAKAERKPLYYRNPMGLADTSPVPKKDAMGMDYVPVYEGDAQANDGNAISLSVDKVQKLGVKSEAAAMRVLDKTVRAAGRIEIDERRTYTVAPKFEGWVERLYVNTGGQQVGKGQPLFDVYSPELVSAQREYAIALEGVSAMKEADGDAQKSMKQLAESSLARLKNWDIADGQLKPAGNGKSRHSLTFYAPVSGIVLEKKAVQGMRFMPGEVLYQIADLSSVWVVADVAEQDIGQVKTGSAAKVSLDAYPGKSFDGKVAFIYPTLNAATRTVQVRVEIANPQGLLKPA